MKFMMEEHNSPQLLLQSSHLPQLRGQGKETASSLGDTGQAAHRDLPCDTRRRLRVSLAPPSPVTWRDALEPSALWLSERVFELSSYPAGVQALPGGNPWKNLSWALEQSQTLVRAPDFSWGRCVSQESPKPPPRTQVLLPAQPPNSWPCLKDTEVACPLLRVGIRTCRRETAGQPVGSRQHLLTDGHRHRPSRTGGEDPAGPLCELLLYKRTIWAPPGWKWGLAPVLPAAHWAAGLILRPPPLLSPETRPAPSGIKGPHLASCRAPKGALPPTLPP